MDRYADPHLFLISCDKKTATSLSQIVHDRDPLTFDLVTKHRETRIMILASIFLSALITSRPYRFQTFKNFYFLKVTLVLGYIKEVYETIVTRVLVEKHSLPDTFVLQRLSEFLMDSISNLTSPHHISQLLTANDTPTNHVTIGKYIKYLCNAFVFYDIKRYDIRGKKY